MKIQTQPDAALAHVASLIEHLSVAMLTHLNEEGALASRPMSALEMDAAGALWMFTDSRCEKVERLRVVNLSFSDGARGTYVSLSGRGEIDTDRDRIQRLWTPRALPWFPDGPTSSHLCLLRFVPYAADYWDAPHSKLVRAFGLLTAAVAAGPAVGDDDSAPRVFNLTLGKLPKRRLQ